MALPTAEFVEFLEFSQRSLRTRRCERGGRAINAIIQMAAGVTNKMSVERIFFRDTFDTPAAPHPELEPFIEAARNAPSAVNAQPWRFLWHGEQLHLFVKRNNPKYGNGASTQYKLFDGGICMGNVTLALEALSTGG